MNPPAPPDLQRTPLAIVVDDQEWTARSLESILSPEGFAVLKAFTGKQALDLLQRVKPDVLFVDVDLPDMDGRELCRTLVKDGIIRGSTPILALCPTRPPREQRLEILRAGAWDIISLPLDPEALVLRLQALVRAKQEADDASDRSLVDPDTGFYNVKGLMRRLNELTAEARRYVRPLSCVVVGPRDDARTQSILREILSLESGAPDGPGPGTGSAAAALAGVLSRVTRSSDAKGLLADQHFVVLAPDTDVEGALRLARRLVEAESVDDAAAVPVCVGLSALEVDRDPLGPGDLLTRATTAFRRAQHRGASGDPIEFFREA